jgi:signal transduction histidine kinase
MENTRIFAETKTAFEKLNRTQRQLFHAQKMEAIGQLAGGMAHDINNQLTIIQACVDLCLPQVGEEHLCGIFRKIHTAAERSANLTRQLMIFGRKQPQFKAALDLNHNLILLQNVIERLLDNDIDLQLDLAPDLYLINADSTNMDQVIINLTLNARDAMPEGGRLFIKTRNMKHDLSVELPEYNGSSTDKYICLSVADTGMGFDEQLKTRIFEPFFTTKGNYNGIGLGLPVVYGIVKSHGGWINVESKPDKGSVFEIYLPAFTPSAEAGD